MSKAEDVFSERVKKTFGTLLKTAEPTSSTWTLSGAEIEKREWRRDKDTSARDATPCSSSFDDLLSRPKKSGSDSSGSIHKRFKKELEDDLEELNCEDEEDEEEGGEREEAEEGEGDGGEWDLRGSIGLDNTLDQEEEEDTFDKVAVGRENAGDRLYMRDVSGNQDPLNISEDDIPGGVENRQRDPRANRWAARIRLKEDDEEAAAQAEQHKPKDAPLSKFDKDNSMAAEVNHNLKPILKRKDSDSTAKPSKHVRFDPGCMSAAGDDEADRGVSADAPSAETIILGTTLNEKVSLVPGYIQNPSKYTHYTFDSLDDMSDKANVGAYTDFLDMIKKSKSGDALDDTDSPVDLSKPVTFIPKRKADTSKMECAPSETDTTRETETDSKHSAKTTLLGIPTDDQLDEDSEVGEMEIDVPKTSSGMETETAFRKQGRNYRSKTDEPA